MREPTGVIHRWPRGGAFFTETASQELFHPATWGEQHHLSEKQVAVLAALIAQPEASRYELARSVGLKASNFDYHLQRIFRVLGVHNRLAAILRAFQLGIFRVDELG